MTRVEIGGADELRALARRLERLAGPDGVEGAVRAGLVDAVPQLERAARANALAILPAEGGLNRRVAASRMRVVVGTALRRVTVRIVVDPTTVRQELVRIDRGMVRHPVYGDREAWVSQNVRAGWFTGAMRAGTAAVREKIERSVSDRLRVRR